MSGGESVRVDKWLWAVRAHKTRTAANEACASGRVQVNGDVAKPATKVRIGDVVSARRRDRVLVYEVVQVLTKRVSPALAAEAFVDRSPPPSSSVEPGAAASGRRDRGQGRPTKRDRRRLDRLQRRQ